MKKFVVQITALNLQNAKDAILLVLICTGRDHAKFPGGIKICGSPKCHPEGITEGRARRAYIFEQDSHKCPIFVEMEEDGGL